MTITLPPDLEAMVQERIDRGPFRDVEEVARTALQRLEDEERRRWLRQALAEVEQDEFVVYTPELLEAIDQSAMQRFAAGKKSVPDVLP